ncbi:hypothetical protein D3C80_1091060 [compost metagenome]
MNRAKIILRIIENRRISAAVAPNLSIVAAIIASLLGTTPTISKAFENSELNAVSTFIKMLPPTFIIVKPIKESAVPVISLDTDAFWNNKPRNATIAIITAGVFTNPNSISIIVSQSDILCSWRAFYKKLKSPAY